MKFNFENFQARVSKESKKVVFPVLALLTLLPSKDITTKLDNNIKKEIKLESGISDASSISYEDALSLTKGLDSKKNYNLEKIDLNLNLDFSKEVAKKLINPDNESTKLAKEIKGLQDKFEQISDSKPQISKGVFSVIARSELANRDYDKKINENFNYGTIISSPLDLKYMTDQILTNLINHNDTIKVLSTDFLAFNETKKIQDDGYLDKGKGFHYSIPEFYLVINKNIEGDEIVFTIDFFDSDTSQIVKSIELKNIFPEGDELKDEEFLKLSDKVISELTEILLKEIPKVND